MDFAVGMTRRAGVPCITGGNIFAGIEVVDEVGHVSADSITALARGNSILTKWGISRTPRGPWMRIVSALTHRAGHSIGTSRCVDGLAYDPYIFSLR